MFLQGMYNFDKTYSLLVKTGIPKDNHIKIKYNCFLVSYVGLKRTTNMYIYTL